MSKFNKKNDSSKNISFEGGVVYSKTVEDNWINFMFSSMMTPTFYESAQEQQSRFVGLTKAMLDKYGPEFVAKAAHYSRNVMGMRSISAMTAALLNDVSFEGKREFYRKYFHRPDDVSEVFGAVGMLGKKVSHGLMRGAKDYIEGLDAYRMGKYKMIGHDFNMYDLINLTHAHSKTVDLLKKGDLPVPETWETVISACHDDRQKREAWMHLVSEDKLGYLALIRNIRNIINCDPGTEFIEDVLASKIVNEEAIRKSMVFPYTIYVANKQMDTITAKIEDALNKALEISLGNVPKFEGSSLSIIDVSGSMCSSFGGSRISCKEISAIYAAQFNKASFSNDIGIGDNDVILFSTEAEFLDFGNIGRITEMVDYINRKYLGGSTFIDKVYPKVRKHYDRILLFSDMQIAAQHGGYFGPYSKNNNKSFDSWFEEYQRKYGKSHVYSFDLANYDNQVVRTVGDISYMTGLNDKVFMFMKMQEQGKSLVDEIKNYKY